MGPQESETNEGCNKDDENFKDGSSKQASIQADSAYSSTYSSLNSIRQQQSGYATSSKASTKEKLSFTKFKKLTSKGSSGGKHRRTHDVLPPKHPQAFAKALDRSQEKTDDPTYTKCLSQKSEGRKSGISGNGSDHALPHHTSQESKAIKVATLTQALGLVDQFKKSQSDNADKKTHESDLHDLASSLLEAAQHADDPTNEFKSLSRKENSVDTKTNQDTNQDIQADAKDGFCVAVSLHDGLVMHTTCSLTSVLGYPKEMWVGRSFIDFIHQDDRETFSCQVTQNISLPLRSMSEVGKTYNQQEPKTTSGTFFCRIRAYNGLKNGFTIKERKTKFCPFKLVVCFSEVDRDTERSTKMSMGQQVIYMFITAIPITPAYKTSFQEGPIRLSTGQTEFVSKHTSQGKFSWFDECATAFTGHLPQNIIGADIFDYFHPADLGIIKETFDAVMSWPGKPCKSKPYRFKVNNGGYVTITSWWNSFINPWSKQLEFIHGKHVVTQGPKVVDIFNKMEGSIEEIPMTVTKQAELTIVDIRRILTKNLAPVRTISQNPVHETSKNKKELASFMGSLLEEVAKAESFKLGQSTKALVMGNISPHYSDSSESPPSYNQLTYNENLTRFFNSQPQTLTEKEAKEVGEYTDFDPVEKNQQKHKSSDPSSGEDTSQQTTNDSGSGEQKQQSGSGSGQGTGHNSSTLPTGMSCGHPGQAQQGGDDGIYSQDGSGSGSRMGSGSRGSGSGEKFLGPPITVELMEVHNKDMEMKMLSQFKETRRTGDKRLIKEAAKQQGRGVQVIISKDGSYHRKPSVIQKHTSKPLSAVPVNAPEALLKKPSDKVDLNRKLCEAQLISKIQQQQSSRPIKPDMSMPGCLVNGPVKTAPLSGFPSIPLSFPTVYIPITHGQVPEQMPQEIVMQGTNYVPMGMMYSVTPEEKPQARAQPELPNCLAVDSCMVICPPPPMHGLAPPVTTTKVDLKGKPALDTKPVFRQSEPSYSTSSSSLYSFLKTSSDALTNQGSGGEEDQKPKIERRGPVLKEPFWNIRVDWNNDLKLKYTMQQTDLQEVLLADRKKLDSMTQPALVNEQLGTLFDELDQGVVLEEFLKDFQGPPTDDDSDNEEADSATDDDMEDKLAKERRKANHLEKMNIFMEAEAPFPMADSPLPLVTKKELESAPWSAPSSDEDSDY